MVSFCLSFFKCRFLFNLNLKCYSVFSCQQIANIADTTYRTEGTGTPVPEYKVSQFSYDANGNLLSINTGKKNGDKLQVAKSRKMLWDEENRLLSVSDNGYVSNYWYDASGERTVKESGDNEGVSVNGMLSGARTGTTNFTAYISPYLVVNNGGNYTKHIYMGGQRITSKVSNSGIFTTSPVTTDLKSKYDMLTADIKNRYDSLGVTYKGTPQSGGLVSSNPVTTASSYFYHSDHLGSSSLITDQSGDIVQHLEYVPFGETFIDERKSSSSWTTPYLFSGKERDEETGLLYFGARYQDSKYGIWYSVDPLAEKYPNVSSYVYCLDNPVKFVDPDGRKLNVTGAIADKAVEQLQSGAGKSITLTKAEDGTMSYKNETGKALKGNAKIIAGIIDDQKNTVNLKTTDTDKTSSNEPFTGGAFMGNTVAKDASGNVISVNANQEVNPNLLGEIDSFTGDFGKMIMHEVTESYQGAIESFKTGVSAPKATMAERNNPQSAYSRAHNLAEKQSPMKYQDYDANGNRLYDNGDNYSIRNTVVLNHRLDIKIIRTKKK